MCLKWFCVFSFSKNFAKDTRFLTKWLSLAKIIEKIHKTDGRRKDNILYERRGQDPASQ